MGQSIAVVSRFEQHLDVFAAGTDGRVSSAWWHQGERWSGMFSIGGIFPAFAPVAAVSRNRDHLDVFVVGNDGCVYTSWWHQGAPWSGFGDAWQNIGGVFPPGAPITAVARNPDQLDLFIVGNDGCVYTSWWSEGATWSGLGNQWRNLGGVFPAGARVAAVSRHPDHLDLFITGHDGCVYTCWWHAGGDWSGLGNRWANIGGVFPAGAPVDAIARMPNHLDLFVTGHDGCVYTSWWHDGTPWSGLGNRWANIGGIFPAAAPVKAVVRMPDHLDLFVTGHDGHVYTSWWHDGIPWSGTGNRWRDIGGVFPPGAAVDAVARMRDHLDVFVVGNDGAIYTSWWHDGADWSGVGNRWQSLLRGPSAARVFDGSFETGGLAALGGRYTVTLHPDGAIRWQGRATNSGIDSYDWGLALLIRAPGGRAIALARTGSIPNRAPVFGDVIERIWDELQPPNPIVKAFYGDFLDAELQQSFEYESDIGATLETLVSWVVRFGVGSLIGPAGGAVILVGLTAGSLVATGNAAAGARLAGNVLWLAGPANTLFALAAEGIASLGERSRPLTQEEYDWANRAVFLGSLPPRDRLVLTDTIGGGDRAFTFPRFDGKITLNMGPGAFDDPRLYRVGEADPKRKRVYGAVFVHELVHACQIEHTPMDLALLADALASKVCEATGVDPYAYPAPGVDYTTLNLEQQAKIVSDWYQNHAVVAETRVGNFTSLQSPAATGDPYYGYVVGNLRVGRF
ncbi:MAG: hypothetical protein ACK5PW_00340 [Burkholderiales bacterium]